MKGVFVDPETSAKLMKKLAIAQPSNWRLGRYAAPSRYHGFLLFRLGLHTKQLGISSATSWIERTFRPLIEALVEADSRR